MSKPKISKNDCYNCKFLKEKEKKSNRKIPNSGIPVQCEIDVVFQCKQHPRYNSLESFPFVSEMPCWEGENNA